MANLVMLWWCAVVWAATICTEVSAYHEIRHKKKCHGKGGHFPACKEGYNDQGRRVQKIRTGYDHSTGQPVYFCLTWPTEDPNPLYITPTNIFLRQWNNTCGLYAWFYKPTAPTGAGPPPHVHWADDEWFIAGGTGTVQLYGQQENKTNVAGYLPGYVQGLPPVKEGNFTIGDNAPSAVAHSGPGEVHYFAPFTNLTDFSTIVAPGIQFVDAVRYGGLDPTLANATTEFTLLKTAYDGIPTDLNGTFVGTRDYRSLTGTIFPRNLSLDYLQQLFDWGESCNGLLE